VRHGSWFNIFLPRFDNDHRPIAEWKFDQTEEELIERFKGLTIFREPTFLTQGLWQEEGKLFEDIIRIYAVFAEDINAAREFLTAMKPKWKRRFRQLEIFMVEIGVEVL
jgi:hypothetical protein